MSSLGIFFFVDHTVFCSRHFYMTSHLWSFYLLSIKHCMFYNVLYHGEENEKREHYATQKHSPRLGFGSEIGQAQGKTRKRVNE